MNIMRYLKGKISVQYCKWAGWRRFGIDRYWSGRLVYLNISRISIHLDCRDNFMDDMVTGKVR